jgi:hypothetical protein
MTARTFRISDHLAARRLFYPSPIISAPSVLVIDIPVEYRGAGLALGRYYAIIVETEHERTELDRFLDVPRRRLIAPTLLDRRPSAISCDNVLMSRYDPPEVGWPWLLVCRWPDSYADAARGLAGFDMARGSYTTEMFEDPTAVDAHSAALLCQLGSHSGLSLRLITGDSLSSPGNA